MKSKEVKNDCSEFVITRVPNKTLKEFKVLSKDFGYDYGMLLKDMVDHYKSIEFFTLLRMVEELRLEIAELYNQLNKKPPVKERKTLGGKVIG